LAKAYVLRIRPFIFVYKKRIRGEQTENKICHFSYIEIQLQLKLDEPVFLQPIP
jgi:hypothetical protein